MIKIEIAGEYLPQPDPEHTVHFEFRRHANAKNGSPSDHLAYLCADLLGSEHIQQYPVKVDGHKKTFAVRRHVVEKLGFALIVE